MTRERRKNAQQPQKTYKFSEEASNDDEDIQSQADEDENDFDSVVSDAQTYELLDSAIRVVDGMLLRGSN
jgi:hypothetical protein